MKIFIHPYILSYEREAYYALEGSEIYGNSFVWERLNIDGN